MKIETFEKSVIYMVIIWAGWLTSEYNFIPSFHWHFLEHIQPGIENYDKCIAFTLLTVYLALFFALWHNFWCMVSLLFMTWGMFNNFLDEMNNKATVLSTSEQIGLILALLTTSILVWIHRKSLRK